MAPDAQLGTKEIKGQWRPKECKHPTRTNPCQFETQMRWRTAVVRRSNPIEVEDAQRADVGYSRLRFFKGKLRFYGHAILGIECWRSLSVKEKPSGADPERKKLAERTREEKNRRTAGVSGERNPTETTSPHSPNPGRRSPAPGSRHLGPATLQGKRGQARKTEQEHTLEMWGKEIPYDSGEIVSQRPKTQLSKRQKRTQRQQYSVKDYEVSKKDPGDTGKVYTVAGDFRQRQRDDSSLKNAWQQALRHEEPVVGPKFLIQNHLLYRIPQSNDDRQK
ncbi:hypothetical protein NDU88_009736 [Pleurodeles waltl]|uniref:Uncharacterized protein n=1 Tax=Pleurodeles waltl TaxID=8319 RepID=A0AAV7RYG3_PLEWA|nr:hypothetical protein NDU88_009736 [Pleurodeles waltl]